MRWRGDALVGHLDAPPARRRRPPRQVAKKSRHLVARIGFVDDMCSRGQGEPDRSSAWPDEGPAAAGRGHRADVADAMAAEGWDLAPTTVATLLQRLRSRAGWCARGRSAPSSTRPRSTSARPRRVGCGVCRPRSSGEGLRAHRTSARHGGPDARGARGDAAAGGRGEDEMPADQAVSDGATSDVAPVTDGSSTDVAFPCGPCGTQCFCSDTHAQARNSKFQTSSGCPVHAALMGYRAPRRQGPAAAPYRCACRCLR
jgi:hypothetical protein